MSVCSDYIAARGALSLDAVVHKVGVGRMGRAAACAGRQSHSARPLLPTPPRSALQVREKTYRRAGVCAPAVNAAKPWLVGHSAAPLEAQWEWEEEAAAAAAAQQCALW